MKICDKCDTLQSDARFFCIDCGEKLGGSVSETRLEKIEGETDKKIGEMIDGRDPFYISVFEKAAGFASLAGVVAALILSVVYRHGLEGSFEPIFSILFFIGGALSALAPKVFWELEKFRLSFLIRGADDAEPSEFYRVMRKITIYGCFIIAVILLAIFIARQAYHAAVAAV